MASTSTIRRMEVPIIVQLGERRMSMREVTGLTPGMIIELPMKVEEDLTLLVANKAIGQGSAVKVGENFGVRISFIGDLRSRLNAATSFIIGQADRDEHPGAGEPSLGEGVL
ncbi:MAG: FliM/FliN family flagellar motor C-terminal domain-containing protein [Phycisphaerales bacterium JB040]